MRTFGIIVAAGVALGLILGYVAATVSANKLQYEAAVLVVEEDEEKPASMREGQSTPEASAPETSFDFGVLDKNEQTEKGEHDFVITNTGDGVLTLRDGGKGCMCTSFAISRDSLKKGEKAIVKVKWDASRGGGVFNQGVRVVTNDPNKKEIVFNVHGLYTAPVLANPNQITFSGVSSSSSHTRDFKVFGFNKTTPDGQPFDMQILETSISNPENYEISIEKVGLDAMTQAEKEQRLFENAVNLFQGHLTLKSGQPQGTFQEILRIRTNDAQIPVLEVSVEGQVTGAVTISGNVYDKARGYMNIGSVSTRNETVEMLRLTVVDKRIINGETLRVASVQPDWLGVEVAYPDEEVQKTLPVKLLDVTVRIPKGSPQGNFVGPDKEHMGRIVFSLVGEEGAESEIIVPVRFAVGP
ncbi:MAG: DUF1573 domain-containing protein [Planctomycetia bacterium]|nr:DUF1573 domain-containing protein [Planctomycetia bacterium]